jgi:dihydroorotase-like cyclic amidohydrolase
VSAPNELDEVIALLRAHGRAQVCSLEPKDCRVLAEVLATRVAELRGLDPEAEWKKAHDAACRVIELQRRTIDEQTVKIAALEQVKQWVKP